MEGKVKCKICGKICSGEEANDHEHNEWRVLLEEKDTYAEVLAEDYGAGGNSEE